jgi:hypothetical protein
VAAPFLAPHWLALDPSANRIVVTADDPAFRVMLLHVDERFRDVGITMVNSQ